MPGKSRSPISSERGEMTTSVTPLFCPISTVPAGSAYWSRRILVCSETSVGSELTGRCGSSRSPSSRMISRVPIMIGSPTRVNSKKPKGRPPASAAASLTRMLTGVPVRASSDPACAEKASGISIRLGVMPARTATTTTTGISAATAPLTLISAVRTATSRQTTSSSLLRLVPPRAITS